MNDVIKRRAPNFSNREKVLLLTLATDLKEIIENKKTNSQAWRDKDDAWQKITIQFNSETPENYPRTKDALRKYYDNIKKNLRKDIADEKKEIHKTGGGTYTVIADPVKELALGLVNPKTVFGLSNNDSDFTSEVEVAVASIDMEEDVFDGENEPHSNPYLFKDHNYVTDIQVTRKGTIPVTTSTSQDVQTVKSTSRDETRAENLPPAGKTKGKRGFIHVESKQSEALKHVWTRRRRPAIQQLSSSKLSEEYLNLAKIKQECFTAEKESILKRRQHEEEIFKLQKEKLLLEISILKSTLK